MTVNYKLSNLFKLIFRTISSKFLIIFGIIIASTVALPILYLVIRSVNSFTEVLDLLNKAGLFWIFFRTFILVFLVTLISIIVGVSIAWIITRTDLAGSKVFSVMVILPLIMPSYIGAMTFLEIFSPRGLLQKTLSPFGVEGLMNLNGLIGATIVLVLLTYPYVYLIVRSALKKMDPSLEDAARVMGYGPIRTFRIVTFPLLRPSVVASGLLVALYTLSDYGAVSMLQYQTFTSVIMLQFESAIDRNIAYALSTVLTLVIVLILVVEGGLLKNRVYYNVTGGVIRRQTLLSLGHWKYVLSCAILIPVILGVFGPILVLLAWLVQGIANEQNLQQVVEPLKNTIFVSFIAAIVTGLLALPISLVTVSRPGFSTKILERVTYLGFGLPGIVVALSLVFIGINYISPVYQTLWLMVFAYVILSLPIAGGAIKSSLLQLSPKTNEAAASLGQSGLRSFISITLPQIKPGIFVGSAIVFLVVMKELPATLILSPNGFDTLATSIWMSFNDAYLTNVAVGSLVLICASGVPLILLNIKMSGKDSSSLFI
jgi:iron(III) transport system permease protein